jgi:Cytochrome P460
MNHVITSRLCHIAATTSLLAGTLAAGACTPAVDAAPAGKPVAAATIVRAQFDAAGHARAPVDWRRWIFVGTPLTPNALNKGKAAFPEFHNVYIEPSAFDAYMKSGTWPEGTQIVKELALVKTGSNAADGSTSETSGRGYFEGEFHGLELLTKDHQRFAKEPGGWAFFSFGHKSPPYDATATSQPAAACASCHEGNADTDFVFTQYYPVLRARPTK